MEIPNTGNVLIDFWSPQCGPCVALAPIIDQIDKDFEDLTVIKINCVDDLAIAQGFGVMALPTLIFQKDGEVVKTLVGMQMKHNIVEVIENL